MNLRAILTLPLLLLLSFTTAIAEDAKDESTQVTATITIPKDIASFSDQTLELRLYEYDPWLADVSADLVAKIDKEKFSHTAGKATEVTIEIGAGATIKPRRNYYLTLFVLDNGKRTHIGERDGKPGICKVINDPQHSRKVKIVVRPVR